MPTVEELEALLAAEKSAKAALATRISELEKSYASATKMVSDRDAEISGFKQTISELNAKASSQESKISELGKSVELIPGLQAEASKMKYKAERIGLIAEKYPDLVQLERAGVIAQDVEIEKLPGVLDVLAKTVRAGQSQTQDDDKKRSKAGSTKDTAGQSQAGDDGGSSSLLRLAVAAQVKGDYAGYDAYMQKHYEALAREEAKTGE